MATIFAATSLRTVEARAKAIRKNSAKFWDAALRAGIFKAVSCSLRPPACGLARREGASMMRKCFWLLAAFCVLLVSTHAPAQLTSWQMNNAAGEEAYKQGRYAEAEKTWLATLKEAESFGPQDPRLATSLNNLALLYLTQSKYAEAEPLLKRALAIWEKALGPEHPNVATSLENYAALLRETNREGEAEARNSRLAPRRSGRTRRSRSSTKFRR